jgi:hypothetical protein
MAKLCLDDMAEFAWKGYRIVLQKKTCNVKMDGKFHSGFALLYRKTFFIVSVYSIFGLSRYSMKISYLLSSGLKLSIYVMLLQNGIFC